MAFFEVAAIQLGAIVGSVGKKLLVESIQDMRTQRRMQRLVDDAVDRVVEQAQKYLEAEGVNDERKELIVTAICERLRPLSEEPQALFRAGLDGERIFEQAHPNGVLPQEISEEGLEQFYSLLFRQIAQLVAGSPLALTLLDRFSLIAPRMHVGIRVGAVA